MDDLSELNFSDTTVSTPEEMSVIQKYFKKNTVGKTVPQVDVYNAENGTILSDDDTKISSFINWKLLGYAILLFGLLANPWVDNLLTKIPNFSNRLVTWLIRIVLFIFCFIILLKLTN